MNTSSVPKKVSGDDGNTGHLEELRSDPIGLMQRVRDECGDIGEFRLADKHVVLLSGAEANSVFFRASEDELDQAAAYPFMKPIFGEGVVFDASAERRGEMLKNQSLRDKFMRGHAEKIASEVERMVANWDDEGEINLLEFFAELTIYTSTACLIGQKFREELDVRFAELFHGLEQGTDALAFVDPYMDIESFRARDASRAGLVVLIEEIMDKRLAAPTPDKEDMDLLDVMLSVRNADGALRFSAHEVTGMFISLIFAGHHTTAGTASWTLIELLRHPDLMNSVNAELDELFADGSEVSYQALREIPLLESCLKESLRLHPPLILLLRLALEEFEVEGVNIDAGKLVGVSLSVSNRLPEAFADPDVYDPYRYMEPRRDDIENPWSWIPFGAGRHRCIGANFAMMQLKAICSVLLQDWTFELSQPPESYRNDHARMVVQLAQPCSVKYRRRVRETQEAGV
ncbi:cytochrome P450 [Actinobacteria bacterium IMCC26207]|nr:cytochrome P450 [Actinobacteria bacterium IMCC26207]